ncbi:MAG: Holliday junction resolvase [Candidatus Diapherotrites archaeon]|nr:Holliday junction resolvase [Candidatus Diapherotrites archaeon]
MPSRARNKQRGSTAERELQRMFYNEGYAVIRAAGSGSSTMPCPDIFVLKGDKRYAIECKYVQANNLALAKEQIDKLVEFSAKSYSPLIVAWKIPLKGWQFLNISDLNKTPKFYTINQTDAIAKSITFETLIS